VNRRSRRAKKSVQRKSKRAATRARRKQEALANRANLANLPFLDSDEFGALAHRDRRSVERWRREGVGPAFLKVRGKVLYETATAISWLRSDARTSTSQPTASQQDLTT
jgi:hypothetical protein